LQHRKEPNRYKHPGRRQAIFLSDQMSASEARSASRRARNKHYLCCICFRNGAEAAVRPTPTTPIRVPAVLRALWGNPWGTPCGLCQPPALPRPAAVQRCGCVRLADCATPRDRSSLRSLPPLYRARRPLSPEPAEGRGLPPILRTGREETGTPSGDTETKQRAAAISTDKHTLHHDASLTSF